MPKKKKSIQEQLEEMDPIFKKTQSPIQRQNLLKAVKILSESLKKRALKKIKLATKHVPQKKEQKSQALKDYHACARKNLCSKKSRKK